MLKNYPQFQSNYVQSRQIDVWLPPNYDEAQTYAVLYMHDGQNLFDPTTATDGITWGVAETLETLIRTEVVPPTIIVGIANTEKRLAEYMPQKALTQAIRDRYTAEVPLADNYLKFLVEELKPFIDANFATSPTQTIIMGSSMGGLISLYAFCEYPQIFKRVGCVSTHWSAGNGIVIDYMRAHLPTPEQRKLYFDFGTQGLDAHYEPYQQKADAIMQQAGYTQEQNWITRKFSGANHHESDWQARVHIPLTFLLAD